MLPDNFLYRPDDLDVLPFSAPFEGEIEELLNSLEAEAGVPGGSENPLAGCDPQTAQLHMERVSKNSDGILRIPGLSYQPFEQWDRIGVYPALTSGQRVYTAMLRESGHSLTMFWNRLATMARNKDVPTTQLTTLLQKLVRSMRNILEAAQSGTPYDPTARRWRLRIRQSVFLTHHSNTVNVLHQLVPATITLRHAALAVPDDKESGSAYTYAELNKLVTVIDNLINDFAQSSDHSDHPNHP